MIDLSYLTEQEQEMIKAVLKRDAALKRVEEERVKKLQRSLRDRSKLKYFTGEWFYETKSRRHRDRIHGSDIIRASLSQKKPITLLELTQMWEERPSFVNSGNKEVFVPAELSGLLEEPAAQPLEAREHRGRNRLVSEVQPEQQKPAVPVTEKQRHNPFNEAQVAPMAAVQTDGLLTNGAVQMVPTSEGEFLLPPKNNVVSDTVINSEGSPALCGTFSEPVAEPKKRTVIHTDLDSPRSDRSCAELHSKTSSPRGFLKHSSSDSSSDMTNPRHDSPSLPHSPSPVTMLTSSGDLGAGAMFTRQTESVSSPDSEQVGFSWVATSGSKEEVELQRACEPGEHYLLDVGNPTLSSFEQKSSHIDTCSPLREGSNDMIHSRVVHEELVKAEDLSLTAARTPANPSSYPSVWTAMVPPCGGTVLHTSQSQNHEHVHHVESHVSQVSGLHTSMNEKGKGDCTRVGGHGQSTKLAFQSFNLTEEESESIAKVLEWFTWSSNSSSSPSDEDEENQESYQLDFKKAKQHPGMPADIKTHFTSRDVRDFTKSSPIKHMTGTLEEKLEGERLYKAEICYSEDVLVSEANPIMPVIDSLCLHTELVCQPKGCLLTAEERQKPEEQTAEEQIFEEGVCDEDITNVSATKVPQDVKSYEAQEEVPQHKVTTLMSFWEQQNRDPKVLISRTNSGLGQTEIEADQQTLFTHEDMAPSSENTDNVHEKYMPETDDIRGGVPVFPPQITRSRISADIEENIEQVCLETGHPTSPKEHFVADSALKTMFSEVNSLSVQSSRLSEGQNEDNFGYTPKSIIVGEKDSSSTQDLTTDSQTRDQKEGGQLLSLFKDSPFITQSNQDPLEEMTLNLQQDLKGKIGPLKSFWEKEKSSPTIIAGQSKNSSYSKSIDEYLESSQCQVNDRFNTSSSVFGTTSKTLDSDDFISSQCSIRPNFTFQQIELSSNFKNVCDFRSVTPSNPVDVAFVKIHSQSSENSLQILKHPHENAEKSVDVLLKTNDLPEDKTEVSSSPNNCSQVLSSKSEVIDSRTCSKDSSPYEGELVYVKQSTYSVTENTEHSYDKEMSGSAATKPDVEMKANLLQHRTEGCDQPRVTWPQKKAKQATTGDQITSKSPLTSKHKKCHPQRAKNTVVENLDGEEQFPSTNVHSWIEGKHLASPQGSRRQRKGSQGGEQAAYNEGYERKSSRSNDEGRSQHTLARSFIPSDYQHYLGISSRAAAPDKNTVKAAGSQKLGSELSPLPGISLLSTPKHSGGRKRSRSEGYTSRGSHRADGNADSSRSSASDTWSQSLASSACDGENSDPGKTTLKQIPSRPMSTSKSLEDIKSLLTLSTAPATPSSSFSDPDQMKRMSMSVPVFVQEENGGRDSDSESSGRSDGQRRTGSSFTNLSASSGVPSVSSQVSGSVMSIYSGDFGSVDVKGTIQFAISYVQKLSEMHIFVVQCRNLAIADIRKNRSDPYVKCYLFPDKAKLGKRKTSVKKKTVNPTYNEILRYRVDIETLRTQTMNLSVWHNDTFGRNSFMGEVDMDLSKWDFSNTQMRDYTLKPRTASGMQPVDYRGEMRVALRFLNQVSQSKQSSKTGEVQIWVKDCKNLPMIRGAAIDPFVKCTVLPDPNKKSRQKTRVLKRTADPQFNHTMVHEGFGPEDLKEACVELTVWDHDRLSNHFIGGLRLGLGTGKSYGAPVDWMDCSSDEAALWERMMDCHNEWVEDVLPLRMLVMARMT
uniref:Synaptotagmin-like protein 2 n=1 Tax=Scleropages formosus TaxID=113540 RepID=A0A8C9RU78_SCLFO